MISASPNNTPMPARNLLVCFDAFGTLFKPKYPIAQQYGDVARSFGLSGFTNDDVATSFKAAFKKESKENPNYGKANGLNAEKWWTNIITNTFRPIVGPNQNIPNGMVPKLLHRFWCEEGYTLFDDVQPLIRKLREAHHTEKSRVVIGVITNSDDRVPDILRSFGMKVRPLRFGGHRKSAEAMATTEGEYDIDFSIMSYDVGHEKPDVRIFEAAEEILDTALREQAKDTSPWRKIYVGDEYDKDVVGAVDAGWNAILIDRETPGRRQGLVWLDEKPAGSLDDIFVSSNAVGFGSLAKLAQWLPPKTST